jgi:hypothetical protein
LLHYDAAVRLSGGRLACYIPVMRYTRPLTFVVLCAAAQVGHAALAGSLIAETPPGVTPIVEPAARKGTRAYTPDGTETAVPAVPAVPAVTPEVAAPAANDALAQCMDTWDAGTHITKSKWREICIRQLKDRDTQ